MIQESPLSNGARGDFFEGAKNLADFMSRFRELLEKKKVTKYQALIMFYSFVSCKRGWKNMMEIIRFNIINKPSFNNFCNFEPNFRISTAEILK